MRNSRWHVLAQATARGSVVLGLVFAGVAAAAGAPPAPSATWSQAFDPGTVISLGLLGEKGGNLQLAGSTAGPLETSYPWLAQEDAGGNILWQKNCGSWGAGGGFVAPTGEGGALVAGLEGTSSQPMLWLVSLDGSGTAQWQEAVSAPPFRGWVDYAFAAPDGWILRGTVVNPLFQSQTPALVKLSASGDLLWQWSYRPSASPGGGADPYEIADLLPLADGGALAAGTWISSDTGYSNVFLLRVGPDGLPVWQSLWDGPDDEMPSSLVETGDGGFLLTATSLHHGVPGGQGDANSVWAVRISDSGQVLWETRLTGPGEGIAAGIGLVDPAGGFLLSGSTTSFGAGDVDAWAARLDADGALLWQKAYGGPGPDWAVVQPEPEGGYTLQGTTAPDAQSPANFCLAALDEAGGILWQKTLGGPQDDWASAARLSDGTYLVAGITAPSPSPGSQAWLLKLDGSGEYGSACAWISQGTLVAQDGAVTAGPLDVQPSKLDLAASAASFSVQRYQAEISDTSLLPQDLCPPLDPLIASASADVTSGAAPLTVHFAGSASGGAGGYTYAWDFGDGGSSTGQNPAHDYLSAGDFSVTLTVTDSLSQTATDGHLTVHVDPPASLSASASADVTSGDAPLTVSFTGSASGGTAPYAYAWDFGDGGTSTEASPGHTYATPGAYSAVLTVTDHSGATAAAAALPIAVYGPLTVTLAASPASGAAPLTVSFSTTAQGGDGIYAYGPIQYGDGQSGTGGHTYTQAGSYQATTTVTDGRGRTETSPPVTIVVTEALAASASADVTSGTAPLTVRFSGSASGGTGSYVYEWAFGDGTAHSSAQNPVHDYASPGSFSAVLTVTDAASRTAAASVAITVTAPLVASASSDVTSGTAPLAVHFSGSASGGTGGYTYDWDFGDSATSAEPSPVHTYAAPGVYAVSLTVADSASHSATDTHLAISVAAPAPPPIVTSIRKAGPPFAIVVTGSNLQNGMTVRINGTQWTQVQYKTLSKVKLTGGKSLKAAVPKGAPTDFTFENPDGGTAQVLGWNW